MEKSAKGFVWLLVVVLLLGGVEAFSTLWKNMGQILIGFFPFIAGAVKQSLSDYFTSPYFIAGVIMTVASGFGIYFGKKGGKVLYIILSSLVLLFGIVSIVSNCATL